MPESIPEKTTARAVYRRWRGRLFAVYGISVLLTILTLLLFPSLTGIESRKSFEYPYVFDVLSSKDVHKSKFYPNVRFLESNEYNLIEFKYDSNELDIVVRDKNGNSKEYFDNIGNWNDYYCFSTDFDYDGLDEIVFARMYLSDIGSGYYGLSQPGYPFMPIDSLTLKYVGKNGYIHELFTIIKSDTLSIDNWSVYVDRESNYDHVSGDKSFRTFGIRGTLDNIDSRELIKVDLDNCKIVKSISLAYAARSVMWREENGDFRITLGGSAWNNGKQVDYGNEISISDTNTTILTVDENLEPVWISKLDNQPFQTFPYFSDHDESKLVIIGHNRKVTQVWWLNPESGDIIDNIRYNGYYARIHHNELSPKLSGIVKTTDGTAVIFKEDGTQCGELRPKCSFPGEWEPLLFQFSNESLALPYASSSGEFVFHGLDGEPLGSVYSEEAPIPFLTGPVDHPASNLLTFAQGNVYFMGAEKNQNPFWWFLYRMETILLVGFFPLVVTSGYGLLLYRKSRKEAFTLLILKQRELQESNLQLARVNMELDYERQTLETKVAEQTQDLRDALNQIKGLEQKARLDRDYLNSIVDNTSEAMFTLDAENQLVHTNRSFRDLFGSNFSNERSLTRKEISLRDFLIKEALDGASRPTATAKICRSVEIPGHGARVLRIWARQLEDPNSSQNHILCMVQDLTLEYGDVEGERDYPNHTRIIGESPAIMRLLKQIDIAAASDSPVLITGETGVGKELVATSIHALSKFSSKEMVTRTVTAIHSSLLESELFGHVKGAFTHAIHDKPGVFEIAKQTTLFLDEIGDLPLEQQSKLLRVLDDGTFQRVGSNTNLHLNARLVFATNRDLEECTRDGMFREDLLHRIRVLSIHVPPLRERRDDIPILAMHFLKLFALKTGKEIEGFEPDVMAVFMNYPWTGNVRELKNTIRSAFELSTDSLITLSDLPDYIFRSGLEDSFDDPTHPIPPSPDKPAGPPRQSSGRKKITRDMLKEAIAENGGNIAAVARHFSTARAQILRLVTRFGLSEFLEECRKRPPASRS